MKVSEVYAFVMSISAIEILEKHGIKYSFATETDRIVNRTGDGVCPMELATAGIDEPAAALEKIKAKLKELSKNK